jgi:uncharacterized protein (TIGR03437 family)
MLYSGLAPDLISVWQINVRIPANTAPGNRALFIQYKSLPSSPPGMPLGTTISVR